MNHPIIDDLQWRHTTKKYDPSRKVSQEDLEVLLEAMRLSASSINSQPWKFIVLESDAAKQRMHKTFASKFLFNQPHIMECSHVILLAHNPYYSSENYYAVVDKGIADQRIKPENRENAFGAYVFAELNADENGNNGHWTKAQTYIALGNMLHTLARLKIDSTTMEGIDTELVNEEFKLELSGYRCDVAVAIGYHDSQEDYNATQPKSRLSLDRIVERI